VNLIEALDAWIDARLDDLSNDELDRVLEIHDAVSASEFVYLETTLVYNEDIDDMVRLAGGSRAERSHTERVLRGAFFDEPMPEDESPPNVDPQPSELPEPSDSATIDDDGSATGEVANAEEQAHEQVANDPAAEEPAVRDDIRPLKLTIPVPGPIRPPPSPTEIMPSSPTSQPRVATRY